MVALVAENPVIVMLDEENGNRYMRPVDKKGLGEDGGLSWLVQDMHQELKSWGYPGGGTNAIIFKSDGDGSIVSVLEALARCHGGRITPDMLPRGEHQSNGAVEEAGRIARDHARVVKIHVPTRIGRELEVDEPIMPLLIRWEAMSLSRFQRGKDNKTPDER